jgi:hypothetical protein
VQDLLPRVHFDQRSRWAWVFESSLLSTSCLPLRVRNSRIRGSSDTCPPLRSTDRNCTKFSLSSLHMTKSCDLDLTLGAYLTLRRSTVEILMDHGDQVAESDCGGRSCTGFNFEGRSRNLNHGFLSGVCGITRCIVG